MPVYEIPCGIWRTPGQTTFFCQKRKTLFSCMDVFFLSPRARLAFGQNSHNGLFHCFSTGDMGHVLSQFTPWTNEIFSIAFDFTANHFICFWQTDITGTTAPLKKPYVGTGKGKRAGKVKVTSVFSSWLMTQITQLQKNNQMKVTNGRLIRYINEHFSLGKKVIKILRLPTMLRSQWAGTW